MYFNIIRAIQKYTYTKCGNAENFPSKPEQDKDAHFYHLFVLCYWTEPQSLEHATSPILNSMFFPLSFNIFLKSSPTLSDNRNKQRHQNQKEGVKLSLSGKHDVGNPRSLPHTCQTDKRHNVAGYKTQYTKISNVSII